MAIVVPISRVQNPTQSLVKPDDQYILMAAAQMKAESEGRQPRAAKAPDAPNPQS